MDYYNFYSYMDDLVKGNMLYDRSFEYIPTPIGINVSKSKHNLLGHYYRHLYMTVKFVVRAFEKNDFLTDNGECMKYLKILRAQLSNSEQIMLFYNWIAGGEIGYGADWENINPKYGSNHFFSDYKMIKNLSFGSLYECVFIQQKVKYIYNRSGDDKSVFEQDVVGYIKKKINR